jgi:hypothetical protein
MIKISDKLTTFGSWLECSDPRVDTVYMWPSAADDYKSINVSIRIIFLDGRKYFDSETFQGVNLPKELVTTLLDRANKYLQDENSTEEV